MAEPKCLNKKPTFVARMHMPATAWHPHRDKSFHISADTEWEAWATFMAEVVRDLTNKNPRLMVGYWLDALNVLPPDVRHALVTGIIQGLGLDMSVSEAGTELVIKLLQRYDPLAGEKRTEQGLVVPTTPASKGLILPGTPGYTA